MRRALAVLVPLVTLLAIAAPAQAASIWTPVASGTTQDISAVDYHSDTQAWFGTAGGQVFRADASGAFVPAAAPPGAGNSITDIAFNPAGTVGFATTALGRLYRSINGGANWTSIALTNQAWDDCSTSATAVSVPRLTGVSWASDGSLAYVVGGTSSTSPVILRITNPGGSPTIAKPNQPLATSGCKVSTTPTTDVSVLPGNSAYATFISAYFGEIDTTSDGLLSVTHFSAGMINDSDGLPRLAVDPTNPNRIWAGDHDTSGDSLYFSYSEDGGATVHAMQLAGTAAVYPNLYGIAYSGGSLVAVGDGGQLLSSIDGKNYYLQQADGAQATTNWRAVSLADASHALVGGSGGALAKSSAANTVPDIVPPAGTISGSETPTVNVASAYTLNAADNAGGSGVDPASITWSADGAAAASGNPAALTFTGTGYHTITASFKDRAGNASSAVFSVNVQAAAPFIPPVAPPPVTPPKTEKSTTVKVPGGTITLGTPVKCVPKNGSFSVRLSLKRRNAKGVIVRNIYRANFYVDGKLKKVDKKPVFTQRLTVKKLKAGSKHKVTAKAYIKMSNKGTRTSSISTTFTVCK